METTVAKKAKEIRHRLKEELGATSRQISVRSSGSGMDSSISVIIKDPTVKLAHVERIAKSVECIDRDKATGEILIGGNLYVDVDYEDGIFDEQAEEIVDSIVPYYEAVKLGEVVTYDDFVLRKNGRSSIIISYKSGTENSIKRVATSPFDVARTIKIMEALIS